ncbi:MAG: hypothetical protein J6S83_11725 [Lachnospiraceae bacterium]|nr:hypothetical protein [Lachnospiraceae bacterium]
MIPWWWALIAWVIGELMAIAEVIICMGGNSKKEEREQLVQAGLLYPENEQSLVFVPADKYDEFIAAREKKAADAGTSTAARETGGKD